GERGAPLFVVDAEVTVELVFFKQEAAYVISTGLEFRRVLFRSIPLFTIDPPGEVHRLVEVGGAGRVDGEQRDVARVLGGQPGRRSEERRVGKEGGSRRATAQRERHGATEGNKQG